MGNKSGYMIFVALFIIVLVLSFPMHASLAMAANVESVRAYGLDGYDGYAKDKIDQVTFEAYIDSVTPVLASETKLVFPSGSFFTFDDDDFCSGSCEQNVNPDIEGDYVCTCPSRWGLSRSYPINVEVDYKGNSEDTELVADYLPPEFESLSISQDEGTILVEYEVKDKSCSDESRCRSRCAGIKEIKVYDEDGLIGAIDISTNTDEQTGSQRCSADGSEEIPYNKEGEHEFSVSVYDYLWDDVYDTNHVSTEEVTFTTDFSAPLISTLFTLKKNGHYVESISQNGMSDATLSIFINDVDLSELHLQLTDLSTSNQDIDVQASDYCTEEENIYNCTFERIHIKLSDGISSAEFDVSAEDIQGNVATQTLSKELSIDAVPPEITSIRSSRYDENVDKSYIKEGSNIIIITATEEGSGLSAENIFLDLSSIDGRLSVQADNCTNVGNEWTCAWGNINAKPALYHGSQPEVYRLGTSKDNAGNSFSGVVSGRFFYDIESPNEPNISIYALGEDDGLLSFVMSGDELIIIANITDEYSGIWKAEADFTELLNLESEFISGECEAGEEHTTCMWHTPPIRSGYYRPQIELIFYDYAGNAYAAQEQISIFNPMSGVPDCFRLVFGQIPPVEVNTIRYLVGSLYYQTIPFTLYKNSACGDAEIVTMELGGACAGGAGIYHQKNGDDYPGFLQMPLVPNDISSIHENGGDTFTVGVEEGQSCAILFTVKEAGRNMYSTPEIENVTLEIPIINDLMKPEDNIADEIDNIIDDVGETKEFIATLDRIFNMAQTLCGIRSVFHAIQGLIVTIKGDLAICIDNPVTRGLSFGGCDAGDIAANAAGLGTGTVLAALDFSVFNYMCAFVTCSNTKDQMTEIEESEGAESFIFPGGFMPIVYNFISKNIAAHIPLLNGMVGARRPAIDEENVEQVMQDEFPPNALELAKTNMWISILSLCIPAVVYNLNKKNQIDCWKGKCYLELIPAGVPKTECDKQYAYQVCVYENGWISFLMKAIGFEMLGRILTDMLLNPMTYAWVLAKYGFEALCFDTVATAVGLGAKTSAWTLGCIPFTTMNVVETSMTLYASVNSFINGLNWDNAGYTDYCQQLEDAVAEQELEE